MMFEEILQKIIMKYYCELHHCNLYDINIQLSTTFHCIPQYYLFINLVSIANAGRTNNGLMQHLAR